MRSQTTPAAVVEHERALVASMVGVPVEAVAYDDGGWDSRVYVVGGGEWVVKFPRPGGRSTNGYDVEVAMLRHLESVPLPVAVQRVRWVDPDGEFVGYAGVTGRLLTDALDGMPAGRQAEIGVVIGEFLRALHEREIDLPRMTLGEELDEYRYKLELALPALRAEFSVEQVGTVERFFAHELGESLRSLGEDLRCCHADLGPWNVLVADDGGVGVIDFGDASIRDPSVDFVALPGPVQAAALDTYGATDELRAKVSVRSRSFTVTDLPFYIGKHDDAGLAAALDRVRMAFFSPQRP